MLAQILLMTGFVLIGVGLYLLKMNKVQRENLNKIFLAYKNKFYKQSEKYLWVGHGDDPFKN